MTCTNAPELAACPFCGGEASEIRWEWWGRDMRGRPDYIIRCENAGCFGPEVSGHKSDTARAIAAWNRRADLHDATLTALRAQVETLREALSGLIDWFDTNGIEDSRLDEARAAVSRDDTSEAQK